MAEVFASGSVDDYFPDYQLSCCMFTLLNRHAARKERCKPLFLLYFFENGKFDLSISFSYNGTMTCIKERLLWKIKYHLKSPEFWQFMI